VTYTPLSNEVRVAAEIVSQIRGAGISAEDEDFAVILEAETDVPERCRKMLRAVRAIEADINALKEMRGELTHRIDSKEARIERILSTVKWAMTEMGLTKLLAPDFSASISAGQRPLIVRDELLPEEFMRVKKEPNRTAIREALKSGREIEGAYLGNPQPVLRVAR
jgi:hypothetical protein